MLSRSGSSPGTGIAPGQITAVALAQTASSGSAWIDKCECLYSALSMGSTVGQVAKAKGNNFLDSAIPGTAGSG